MSHAADCPDTTLFFFVEIDDDAHVHEGATLEELVKEAESVLASPDSSSAVAEFTSTPVESLSTPPKVSESTAAVPAPVSSPSGSA